jgi:antitoxin component YwqK of YwqJK toxin-antitoxin module
VGRYVGGKPIGDWVGYFDTGQKKYECSYVGGVKHGEYREWFNNGQKKVETVLVNGQLHGDVVFFNKDGTVNESDTGKYENGKKDGKGGGGAKRRNNPKAKKNG